MKSLTDYINEFKDEPEPDLLEVVKEFMNRPPVHRDPVWFVGRRTREKLDRVFEDETLSEEEKDKKVLEILVRDGEYYV